MFTDKTLFDYVDCFMGACGESIRLLYRYNTIHRPNELNENRGVINVVDFLCVFVYFLF